MLLSNVPFPECGEHLLKITLAAHPTALPQLIDSDDVLPTERFMTHTHIINTQHSLTERSRETDRGTHTHTPHTFTMADGIICMIIIIACNFIQCEK